MTWTYQPSFTGMSPKDAVRLAIGDTVSSDPQLQDEEITQFLAGRTTIMGACADACRSLASKFARSVTQKAATTGVNFSDMSKAYARMATAFDQRAAMAGGGLPYAGGISVVDKVTQEQDADRVSPQFNIGMEDNLSTPIGPTGNETPDNSSTSGQ